MFTGVYGWQRFVGNGIAFADKLLGDYRDMFQIRYLSAIFPAAFAMGFLTITGGLRAQTVTWSEHIAPILYNQCTNCHREDGVAPFSLMSYDEARERAAKIVEVVEGGTMPLWQPDSGYGPKIIGEFRLSNEEIRLIKKWNDQGRKRGSSRRAPKPPKYANSWSLGEPGLVIELSEPYLLPAEGGEIVRSFVVPVPVEEPKFVAAIEFLPQSQRVIHQALVQVDESDGSRRRDAMDPAVGFGASGLPRTDNPSGQFMGWTPGRVGAHEFPEGTAWLIKPNHDLVLQLRMSPTGQAETVNPRIGLYFSDEAPVNQTGSLHLRADKRNDGELASAKVLEERIVIPTAVSVLGISPYASLLVEDLELFAELPNGETQWLVKISDWDHSWQSDYRYEEPLLIPAKSNLVMRSSMKGGASANLAGNLGSVRDSLGGPVAEVKLELLLHDSSDKASIQEMQTDYEIARAGGPAAYAFSLGVEMERIGRIQEAITAYEQAAQGDAKDVRAMNNLGRIYESQENKTQAEYYYREAIDADPNFHAARLNLGKFLRKANRQQAAARVLQEALDADPSFLDARVELSAILVEQKLLKSGIKLLEEGLKLDPMEPYLNLQTGKLYVLDGKPQVALPYLEKAAEGNVEDQKFQFPLKSIKIEANWIPALMFEAGGNLAKMNEYADRVFEIDPTYVVARVFLANKMLESRQETEARRHLEVLLKLPLEQQPFPNELITDLSFPDGVMLLADIYKRTQRSQIGKGILEQALAVAKERGNRIWITQIQNEIARYR